ncbi:L,D-transpeptidase family protein [Caenimonas koreensis]|uniref:L,D-transpeptidase family protein n=1 Tax=Caenimonas koreensis DSM 17982 TaxID=1121255 RepID=A0A844B287_9BURK|nr:L,D-transpeptidase family protein [Caenimonas koreensis]MRD47382.1 L,D-transpeptidase family protein [Caenimonas koreensis DSM 17982]
MKRASLALCLMCLAAALPGTALSSAHVRKKPASAAKAAKVARQVVLQDGHAEARLLEIYRLIAQAKPRDALAKAESLVRDHPNFQLAQLTYGDLLSLQVRPIRAMGDVPDFAAKSGSQSLSDLREESQLRIRALLEKPPANTIPAQFLQLSPQNKHAIAVDTSRARLYLFENTSTGLKLLGDYYISVGKSGIDKVVEGDLRTPLGVYFITSNLDPKSLKDFYGAGALPINYPNPYDARRGKTGSGIWLHGTPPSQFARAPKATDGCVVLANQDLQRIISTVEVRTTPVVIAPALHWVAPQSVQPQSRQFADVMQAWRAAKVSGDPARILSFYSTDFNGYGKTLAEWTPTLKAELDRARGRNLQLKDLSYLQWSDNVDTMVVTFGEVVDGDRTGAVKRQYWMRQGAQWKIFFEGVIG